MKKKKREFPERSNVSKKLTENIVGIETEQWKSGKKQHSWNVNDEQCYSKDRIEIIEM